MCGEFTLFTLPALNAARASSAIKSEALGGIEWDSAWKALLRQLPVEAASSRLILAPQQRARPCLCRIGLAQVQTDPIMCANVTFLPQVVDNSATHLRKVSA